jgi:hypothetical protein
MDFIGVVLITGFNGGVMKVIVLVVVALGLLIGGCEQKSEPVGQESTQVKPEATASLVDQTKTVVNEAVQQVDAAVDAGKEKLHQAGAAAEQAVQEVKENAAQDLAAGAVVAQEKAAQALAAVQQQASAVKQDGGNLLNTLADKVNTATPAADSASAAPAEVAPAGNDLLSNAVAVATDVVTASDTTVEILVIKNAKGNVTLKHALHGEKYGCAVCQGDGVPAAFELGKDRAHKLCKDCHKQNNGPVTCSGCHVK